MSDTTSPSPASSAYARAMRSERWLAEHAAPLDGSVAEETLAARELGIRAGRLSSWYPAARAHYRAWLLAPGHGRHPERLQAYDEGYRAGRDQPPMTEAEHMGVGLGAETGHGHAGHP